MQIVVRKPKWEVGAKRPIALKRPSTEPSREESAAPKKQVWSVVPEDDELLEEDDFLTEDDLKPVVAAGVIHGTAKQDRQQS